MNSRTKAVKWFKQKGIEAYEKDGSVFVEVSGYDDTEEIEISQSEIEYRAELWDENNEESIEVDVTYFVRSSNVELCDDVADNEVTNYVTANIVVALDDKECKLEVEYKDTTFGDMSDGGDEIVVKYEGEEYECMHAADAVRDFFDEYGEKIVNFVEDSDAIEFIENTLPEYLKDYCEEVC